MGDPVFTKIFNAIKRKYSRWAIARDGFWFVDVPRTSSSSLRSELGMQFSILHSKRNVPRKRYAAKIIEDHQTASQMAGFLGGNLWNQIFTFSVVRNPWDRTFSFYNTRKGTGQYPKDWSLADYVRELYTKGKESPVFQSYIFRKGAAHYLVDNKGRIMVDMVARFENRDHDLALIAERIGSKGLGRRHLRRSSPEGQHYSNFYEPESIAQIAELYAQDIELFGYEFEDKRKLYH